MVRAPGYIRRTGTNSEPRSGRPDLSDARRRKRREIKLLSNESVWLQKALFALQKVEGIREKIAELHGDEDPEPLVFEADGQELRVEDFQEAMENRVKYLLEEVRERRKVVR
jgi:hypothetical protein